MERGVNVGVQRPPEAVRWNDGLDAWNTPEQPPAARPKDDVARQDKTCLKVRKTIAAKKRMELNISAISTSKKKQTA